MRTYEVVFIAAPGWTVEELDAFTAQMQAVIEGRNGKVLKTESWGKKQLAYKIDKFREGYYVVMTLEGNGAIIAELERRFRVTDHIIRFLSVRLDEDMKRSEKLKAARRRKTARAAAAAAVTRQAPQAAGEQEPPAQA